MKLNTQEEIQAMINNATEYLKENGWGMGDDDINVIQPFDDNEFIQMVIEDDDEGERKIKIEVSNNLVILPSKKGTLDIYVEAKDD